MPHLLLLISSASALAVLVWHAWMVRPRRVAISFLVLSLLFGLIRGNIIGFITTVWFVEDQPYLFNPGVLRLGYASIQECLGWTLTLYLSWCLAERLCRKLGFLGDPVYPIGLAGCLFCTVIGYTVETGAAAWGWWQWGIPTSSAITVEFPMAGVMAWYSVGAEFLLPFLVALSVRESRRRIIPLLILPFILDMLANAVPASVSVLEFRASYIYYAAMLTATVLLACYRQSRPLACAVCNDTPCTTPDTKDFSRFFVPWLPFLAALLVLAVPIAGILLSHRPALLAGPASFLCLILCAWVGWPLVTAFAALGALLLGTGFIQAAFALLPCAALILPLLARNGRRLVHVVPVCIVILTLATAAVLRNREIERQMSYIEALKNIIPQNGAPHQRTMPPDLPIPASQRPASARFYEQTGDLLLKSELPFAARRVLEDGYRIDPAYAKLVNNLAIAYMVTGDMAGARKRLLEGLERNPLSYNLNATLAHLLVESASPTEALPYADRAILLAPHQWNGPYAKAEALLALNRRAEAAGIVNHWLEKDPKAPRWLGLKGRLQ